MVQCFLPASFLRPAFFGQSMMPVWTSAPDKIPPGIRLYVISCMASPQRGGEPLSIATGKMEIVTTPEFHMRYRCACSSLLDVIPAASTSPRLAILLPLLSSPFPPRPPLSSRPSIPSSTFPKHGRHQTRTPFPPSRHIHGRARTRRAF